MIGLSYKNDPILSSEARFLSLLKILSQYPLPKPLEVRKTYNRKSVFFNVTTFTDKGLLKALTPKVRTNTHLTLVDDNSWG